MKSYSAKRSVLFIFRGATQERVLGRNLLPQDFLYGMNDIKLSNSLRIESALISKGAWRGILSLLRFIEVPFSRITKLGFPLEIFWLAKRELARAQTIVCINDAIGFSMLFWKSLGFISSDVFVIFQSLSERYKYFSRNRAMISFIAFLLKRATKIFTLSDVAQKELHHRFDVPTGSMTTFRFGVDVHFWKPLKIQKTSDYIFTIGNDMNRDNLTLYDSLTDTDTLIHVSNTLNGYQKSKGIIQYRRSVTDEAVRHFYNCATMVVIPSISLKYESSGLSTILQAMACRRPVITSYNPSLAEIFTHKKNILFYRPESKKDLKATIQWSREHPKRLEKIARNGYTLVREKYTTEHMGAQWTKILND